ncbi:MAG: 3-phosphoserine/phosphohydroxythreonine transaminase [SAR324 cluster bacterium]|nr:3-phosphoserine/phosphohydroxythreonine transaminase [SAR324 cluster bacterium]
MTSRVHNFTGGPSTLPLPVLHRIQEEFLDFQGIGASIVEISHRTPQFEGVRAETEAMIKELMELPPNYKVLFAVGGGVMQMAMAPMNLIATRPARKAAFVHTGIFTGRAISEASKYGTAVVAASGEESGFTKIPAVDASMVDEDASYLHIALNNTVHGTQFRTMPQANGIPLVGDATSEILSRKIDVSPFGMIFAGFQKNLGVVGLSLVVVREDLLGHAVKETPKWMDCAILDETDSMPSTTNPFTIYVCNLVLHWLKEQGGVAAIEPINVQKAARLYGVIDKTDFYIGHAHPDSRSNMNVTFNMATPELEEKFVVEAEAQGLYSLKGHRELGGIRASIYNALPMEWVEALASFMEEFERRNG